MYFPGGTVLVEKEICFRYYFHSLSLHESLYEKEAHLDYATEETFSPVLARDQPDSFEWEF